MSNASVMFFCGKCGCQTPGDFIFPEHAEAERPITLTQDCFHCDEPLERRFSSPAELRKVIEAEKVLH